MWAEPASATPISASLFSSAGSRSERVPAGRLFPGATQPEPGGCSISHHFQAFPAHSLLYVELKLVGKQKVAHVHTRGSYKQPIMCDVSVEVTARSLASMLACSRDQECC